MTRCPNYSKFLESSIHQSVFIKKRTKSGVCVCHKTWHATFNSPTGVLCQNRLYEEQNGKCCHIKPFRPREIWQHLAFGWIDFFAVDGCQLFFSSVLHQANMRVFIITAKTSYSLNKINAWTYFNRSGKQKLKSNQETFTIERTLALKKESKGVETMETPLATSVRSTTSTGWSEVQGDGVHESSLHSLLISASIGIIRTAQYWKRFQTPCITHAWKTIAGIFQENSCCVSHGYCPSQDCFFYLE